ncbi:hypothetical protein HZC53_01650 [Candidatus Uhrbacteria bacterium]|nr:hypothetical protein [Candidatus Uhrbacteria bacterium]
MGERHPPYTLVWTGSFPEARDLPKSMRRVLQNALTTDREDPAKFLVSMGRLLRFCDIGTPCRRRALRAAAMILTEAHGIRCCFEHSLAISQVFSRAFRAVRYRESHVWSGTSSPGLAVIMARDDLESLWQAVRRGVPILDMVKDPVQQRSLLELRRELDDHIQMVDALHEDALDGLVAQDLAKHQLDHETLFVDDLAAVEPVRWWMSVFHHNIVNSTRHG